MATKTTGTEECTAGTYATLMESDAGLVGRELRELLADADTRVVPSLTLSVEESRLEALVAVVRDKTREEVIKAFCEAIHAEVRDWITEDVERIGAILGEVVLKIRKRQRLETAAQGGLKRAENSRIEKVKPEVQSMYHDWQHRGSTRHKSIAAFARAICEKFPIDRLPKLEPPYGREIGAGFARSPHIRQFAGTARQDSIGAGAATEATTGTG